LSQVWYVSYGSNMSLRRFACYIEGGTPPGGTRRNPGARDRRLPERTILVDLPGTVYFAGESPQWGGGVAFYDHTRPGFTAARGYLVTAEQFADIAAQEMYRAPRSDDPLAALVLAPLRDGRHELGPGRYETLVEVGRVDDLPLLTFTSPHGIGQVPTPRPSTRTSRWSRTAFVSPGGGTTARSRGTCPRSAAAGSLDAGAPGRRCRRSPPSPAAPGPKGGAALSATARSRSNDP